MLPQLSRSAARPASLLALCGALLLAVVLALPAPAQAHDTLLSTDPEDGTSLETSPEDVTFTFSDDILDVSPLVRITDEAGDEVAEITPSVDGPTATATLPEPLQAGTYDIQWRVVSSDGHPIEGTLTLTVEQDTAAEEDPAAESSDGGGEDPAAAADDGDAEQPAAQDDSASQEAPAEAEEDSGLGMGALVIVLAVVIVGAIAAVVVIMRRRS